MSPNTQAETVATVQGLPGSQVVYEPFAQGSHNITSEDPALNAQLDAALRDATVGFLAAALQQ